VQLRGLPKSFDGSFLDCGRSGGTRLRFALDRLRDGSLAIHHRHRGVFAPRGFFHRRFASQAPPHEQHLIVLERTGMGLLLGDAENGK
jgi:hypothetical protein